MTVAEHQKLTEEERWHECFTWFARRPERGALSPDGAVFVRELRKGFARAAADVRTRSAGHRGTNATVLCRALTALLIRRGVSVHPTAATEVLVEQRKTVDLSFDHRGEWLIEIKFGLEFNSLAAAAMEGLIFKAARPRSRFLLLAMYSKFRGNQGPARAAEGLLRHCGIAHSIDGIHVLTRSELLNKAAWAETFADGVNRLCRELPAPPT